MDNQSIKTIFKSALQIAIRNGHVIAPASLDEIMYGFEHEPTPEMIYIPIIFSHDFAKSFFGAEWQEHLQKMVLEEEPIRYIENLLDQV